MSNNDGKEVVRKKCPFLKEWCIGEACNLFTQMTLTSPIGVPTQQGMCAFTANCMILSGIVQQLAQQKQVQPIKLPHLFRG